HFTSAMVRNRTRHRWIGDRRQTGSRIGGTTMTPWPLAVILIWLAAFVAGQLLFKRAMESSRAIGFRNPKTIFILSVGVIVMTMSFCLNLGLLQHFDLSYIYPFQGSSIIIITLLAAMILKERLTARLVIGTLVITAGVVLVSMS